MRRKRPVLYRSPRWLLRNRAWKYFAERDRQATSSRRQRYPARKGGGVLSTVS